MSGEELLRKYGLLDDRAKSMIDVLIDSQLKHLSEAPETAYYKVLEGEANNSSRETK